MEVDTDLTGRIDTEVPPRQAGGSDVITALRRMLERAER
jgi:hypothetical protein